MPSWSTPAYSPDRSLVWPNSFYYLRTDSGGANLPGSYTTALSNTATYHSGLPNGDLFRFEPFATSDWDYSGTTFPPLVTAGYFHEVWPGGATTPTTWTISYPQGSTGTSHLYFGDLRQENAFKALPFFGGGYVPQSNGGYDRHAVLWAESVAYGRQLMEAYGYDGVSPNATQAVTYDLTDYTLPMGTTEPAGVVAGRLPVAPFQFTYSDLVAAGTGDLGHMIGWVAANYANDFQWPARADDGELAAGSYLKAGSVIRLSSSWTIPSGWPETLKALARTLQRYGAVLFDKNSTLADTSNGKAVISSVSDPAWPTSGGTNTLANLWAASGPSLPDFEEVDITGLKVADGSIEVSSSPPPVGPTASFTATPTSGTAPLTVTFTDTSTPGSNPITGWAWDFGDSTTSTLQNPTHTYTTGGTYTVTLVVTDSAAETSTSPPVSIVVTEECADGVWTYVQTANPSSAVGGDGTYVTSLTPALPVTTTDGDLLILYAKGSHSGVIQTWTAPAGWTEIGSNVLVDLGVSQRYNTLQMWWKVAGPGETSPTVTQTAGAGSGIQRAWYTGITNYRSSPNVVVASVVDAADDASPALVSTYQAPAVTTLAPATMLEFRAQAGFGGTINIAALNGWVSRSVQASTPAHRLLDQAGQPDNGTYVTALTDITPSTARFMSKTFYVENVICYECSLTSNSPVAVATEPLDLTITIWPGAGTITSYDVIWGDGNTTNYVPPPGVYVFTPSHTYAAAGVYMVQVIVYNNDEVLTSCSLEVLALGTPCPPVVIPASEWPDPLPPGLCFGAIGFNVGGFDIVWTAEVDWGDGNTDNLNGEGGESIAIGHVYATGGSYNVTLSVVQNGVETICDPVVVEVECVPERSAQPAGCLPGAVLGTGEDLRIYLVNRGATLTLAELVPTSGFFTRDLDQTSELEVTGVITGLLDETCCDGWNEAYPWVTEVLVYRDGRDAWSGPVTDVEFGYGTVRIRAADLTAWWDRRVVPDLSFTGADLADIFTAIHDAAMLVDPVPNFSVSATPTGIFGQRQYVGSEYQYAKDALEELSKTGLDWTCYGRTVLIGGEEVPANPYFTLTDDFWTQPPTVASRGNEQATQVIVRGKGVTGVATADATYLSAFGTLVRVFDEQDIEDQSSVSAAARSRLALLKDQTYIETPSGATLTPTAPITVPELIPGMRVRVTAEATCRPIVADFRLKKVKVDFNGSVSIDLQPLGTDQSNTKPEFAKMVVIGDSLSAWSAAAATAAGKGEPASLSPSNRWQDLLVSDGLVGYSVNGATPGLTTRSALATPVVPPQSCDLLVIYLGANDMVHQDRTFPPGPFVPDPLSWVLPPEYYDNLLDLFDAYPHDEAVLVFPWKWNINLVDSAWDTDIGASTRMAGYRTAAFAAANARGARIVDLSETYNAPSFSQNPIPDYLIDPLIHASDSGHRGVADLIKEALTGVLP